MAYFYSKDTNGFYHDSLMEDYKAAGTLPENLVEISDECHKELIMAQSEGKMISAGENGFPVLVERKVDEEAIKRRANQTKQDQIRKASDLISTISDMIDAGIASLEEEEYLGELKKFRVEVFKANSIEEIPEFPSMENKDD